MKQHLYLKLFGIVVGLASLVILAHVDWRIALVIYEDRSYTVTGGEERALTAKELRHKIMLQTKKVGE